jgi:hypothetical protein
LIDVDDVTHGDFHAELAPARHLGGSARDLKRSFCFCENRQLFIRARNVQHRVLGKRIVQLLGYTIRICYASTPMR